MPESALWSLIVALVVLALGFALKVAQLTHRLNEIAKKSASFESEIQSFQDAKDKEISDIKELHATQIKESSDTIADRDATLVRAHKHLTMLEEKLNKSTSDIESLKSSSAEFERLAAERKFLLDVKEKELAALRKPAHNPGMGPFT